jgi:hypothetical protein
MSGGCRVVWSQSRMRVGRVRDGIGQVRETGRWSPRGVRREEVREVEGVTRNREDGQERSESAPASLPRAKGASNGGGKPGNRETKTGFTQCGPPRHFGVGVRAAQWSRGECREGSRSESEASMLRDGVEAGDGVDGDSRRRWRARETILPVRLLGSRGRRTNHAPLRGSSAGVPKVDSGIRYSIM